MILQAGWREAEEMQNIRPPPHATGGYILRFSDVGEATVKTFVNIR